MDRSASPETMAALAEIVQHWPGVHGFHDLKTRTAGATLFVQMHIELDGAQTLHEAHEISRALKRAVCEAYPHADVIIHQDLARAH